MMRRDWLNRTFDSDREGISTYGGRPRSANSTTSDARSRIDPSVFLSFEVSVTFSDVFFVFLAIVFRVHDNDVLTEILGCLFDLFAAVIHLSIGHSRFLF